jgi:HdeA/HdeB family protein
MRLVLAMLLLGLVVVTLRPGPGDAQVHVIPRRIDITAFTCGEVLALNGEQRDRALIYFNGYLDGKAGAAVWVEEIAGARIERALAQCKMTPALPLLDAFARAWNP